MKSSTTILVTVLTELNRLLNNVISGTKLEDIRQTINQYAIASAVASIGVAFVPGTGGVAAALAQSGFVWATYVKINKTMGISMSEEVVKFLGAAMITNLMANYGVLLIGHILAEFVSCIPLFGGVLAAVAEATIGYVLIYACAIIYLKLICKMVGKDGTITVPNREKAEKTIKELMQNEDIAAIFNEAKEEFNKARRDGSFDKARKEAKRNK